MKNTAANIVIPHTANFVQCGHGTPVIMVHGIAASLHDWDELIPRLNEHNYASYALDLLGHGDSPKPKSHAYHMDWLFEHFSNWVHSLNLTQPPILIGHSLGGHLVLEYTRRASFPTRGLILVNPFFSRSQLHPLLRRSYRLPNLTGVLARYTPTWFFRLIVDLSSMATGHSAGALHSLPPHIRAQTALDYTRTAPGVYNIPATAADLKDTVREINIPTLIAWGDKDQTLAPESFPALVASMPNARGKPIRAGHVPHQSNAQEFNELVLEFLKEVR